MRRRDFLKVGALGATGIGLSNFLRQSHAGEISPSATARSAILIFLEGGPSHLDTFDFKPDAPEAVRGEFSPIETTVPGLVLSEHLPRVARIADRCTVLRGMSHNLAAHELGRKYVVTGNRPLPALEFPGLGSIASKELPHEPDLPFFVAIPRTPQVPGFLGISHGPFQTRQLPKPGSPFTMRGIELGETMTVGRLERRQALLEDLDVAFRGFESRVDLLEGLDRFSAEASAILSSPRAREAFAVNQEPANVIERFGPTPESQGALLACRLIEAGVRFATLTIGGWDTHQDNFGRLADKQLPILDAVVAGTMETLEERGLLDSTLVVVVGEFGRTPKINARGGRDHWPRAMFALLAGGGVARGRIVGASDEKGMGPAGETYSPDDLAASIHSALGIDFRKEYHTSTGRPVMISRDGRRIEELFG